MATIDVRDLGTLNLFRARARPQVVLEVVGGPSVLDDFRRRHGPLARSHGSLGRVKSPRAGGRRVGAAKKSYSTGSSMSTLSKIGGS